MHLATHETPDPDEGVDELRQEDIVAEAKRQLACGPNSSAMVPTSATAASVIAASIADVMDEHSKLHMPAWPEGCDACRFAKSNITKSFELTHDERMETTAKEYGEKVHLDLLGPTRPSVKNEIYLLCARDDASGKPNVSGLKDKSAEEVWEGFDNAVDITKVKAVQKDFGREFAGVFHDNCIKHGISDKPRTLPYRPKTNSRAERFHGVLENGVRCFFFISMVPYIFWVHVAQTFCQHYTWSWVVNGTTPYEFVHGSPYVGEKRDFGSLC